MSEEREHGELLLEVMTASTAQTMALGRALGKCLEPGEGLVLVGEMGAGKTVFVRGIAHGLAVFEPDEVCSPTYLLMMEHAGPKPLLHLDAYFAERSRDFLLDGGDAYVRDGFVLAIEWPERLAMPIPEEYLRVEIDHVGMDRRSLAIRGSERHWRSRLKGLETALQEADTDAED